MFPDSIHRHLRFVTVTTLMCCGPSVWAAPPKAIRVEPLGIPAGATSEIVIHGTNLANPTDVLSSLNVANQGNTIALRSQVDDDKAPLPSKLTDRDRPQGAIVVEAENYSRGQYRRNGIFIVNGDFSPNYAEYDIEVAEPHRYQLELKYASGQSRPVKLFLNGQLLTDDAAAGVTGGFGDSDSRWMTEGIVSLKQGKNVLRLERPGGTPHFDKVGLVPTDQPVTQFSSAKPSDRVAPLKVAINKKWPVGIYGVRIATTEGISNPVLFMVDDLPTVHALRETHSTETAQKIELPVAIDGVTESGKSDYFQFSGTAGDWLSIEAVATRLGTKLDPVVRLLNQSGKELAFVDDSPSLAGDCRVRLRLPETGTFFVTIEDSAMGGSSAHEYRLRIGDFSLDQPQGFSNIADSELPQFEHVDQKPFTQAEIGSGLGGIFNNDRPVHRFRFPAKKGDRLVLTDRSRQFGAAAMLGLSVLDEEGKLIGENRRAGTSGGTLNISIPEDGAYDIELSELTHRTGADFGYYAELRRSVPDFELSFDTSSVILPQDGYAIVKVTANRKGYNGPIKLTVTGRDQTLAVANDIIQEKKKDTRLKIYIPPNMQPGQVLSLQVLGTAQASSTDEKPLQRYASTLAVLRKNLPQTPHPPSELQLELAAVVGPAIPDFFALSLDDGAVFFPRHVGEVYFTVRVKERTKGFKDPVLLRIEGLPDGFSASGGEKPVSRSENNEYRFQLRGPAEPNPGTIEIRIIGEASFKGQTKEVTLAKVPMRIIEPLIITATADEKSRPGGKQTVNVSARRFVPRAGGDMKAITLTLADSANGFTLRSGGVIAAARKNTQIQIDVADSVKPGTYSLVVQATTEVAGHKFTVSSTPFPVTIAGP